MKITVASGKGGTGKTTVTAALATLWEGPVTAVDLDVEAPNLHLFLDPEITGRRPAVIEVPEIDTSRCTRCGVCADLCQFKAISVMGEAVMTFPELCHGCGGCKAVCPVGAVGTGFRTLGDIAWGRAGKIDFVMGRLRVGEAMSPPLIVQVKNSVRYPNRGGVILMDAPPGVSCPAVHAVMDTDIVLLVTEPTPFGVYDLTLALEAFGGMNCPVGVIVNRCGIGDDAVYRVCRRHDVDVLAEIPFHRDIASAYARGEVITRVGPEITAIFRDLIDRVVALREARDDTGSPVYQR